jgi:enterochelin esterase-like enzyme
MKLKCFALTAVIAFATNCMAQGALEKSTVVNKDGTVTFKYWNDYAKDVQVDVQFAGRKPMTKGADGVWTATLGPAAPDMYPYCFIVDGIQVMDPRNQLYFPNEGFKNSLLEISDGKRIHDIKDDVPHGRVEYVHYYSKSLGATNNAIVCLPPNYMMDRDKKYPVFYCISGTTDTEEVYYKVGRVNYILDNLLNEKAAKEMIIVLPYGNPSKLKPAAPAQGGAPQMQFGGDVFSKDLINDLMPYIEKNYRTINNADNRAIGGFSRGGNQALAIGLTNLDKFSYLCSYSSFTSTTLPEVYDNAAATNKKIHLFWLGVGTDDFLYGNARDYMEFLDQKGITSVKEFTTDKFGHTWMNARYFLDKTLRLLFNKKASEEAMKNAQPAPAKTGQEQQFTGATMARLFPRPVVSPEYTEEGIIFRLKAPDADTVKFNCDILPAPMLMEKDTAGVWSITISDFLFETFRYCFLVDNTPVADPSNMYLSPDKGFKYSVADNPNSPYNFASQGEIEHGRVAYDLEQNEAWYTSPTPGGQPAAGGMGMFSMPTMIQLVPGKDDTMESWFKVGGADAIVDRLIADGKAKACILTTSSMDFMQNMPGGGARQGGGMPGFQMDVLKADDYPTWSMRRAALIKLLLEIAKRPAPQFGGFGGGQGRGGQGRGQGGNRRGGGFGGGGFGGGGFGGGGFGGGFPGGGF